jgi:branched-chain amino acid transport system permease protein
MVASMSFFAIQLFNGLSHATTLFLMAAGLTLIFGVTRIVNFAHGSFYMLGAMLSAHIVTLWLPSWGESAWGYAGAMLIGAACAGLVGAVAEFVLLRRMVGAPELYQLVATFGLTLFMHDAMLWGFGPDEVFAPRFPGLKGSVEFLGEFFPTWHIVTIVLGPLVWLGLHLLLTKTTWGQRLRAATADRAMLAALGINPAPLMLGAVVLGTALAGLGGALRLPSEPANLQMDVNVVVETFVVVVTGGLGSIGGAFLAALLIGMIHAFGVSLFPQATLVIVFMTMAVVLAVRPQGLLGSQLDAGAKEMAQKFVLVPVGWSFVALILIVIAAAAGAWAAGDYWRSLAADALILAIFGISLQTMMGLGGLVSFGHAAFFALGAYGAALSHTAWGLSLPGALAVGCVAAGAVAAAFGTLVVRSAGVYLAMLSLALAQVVWATATQWVGLAGGDNGVIGLSLVTDDTRSLFYALLVFLAVLSVAVLGYSSQTRFGAALQAARDAPERAAASGLAVGWLRYRVFVESAVLAGLAGGLFAAHKGAVFPSAASVGTSVDALLVVLIGGVHWLWGALAGSVLLTAVQAELGRSFTYWRGALGLLVMLLMVLAPSGLGGLLKTWQRPSAPSMLLKKELLTSTMHGLQPNKEGKP